MSDLRGGLFGFEMLPSGFPPKCLPFDTLQLTEKKEDCFVTSNGSSRWRKAKDGSSRSSGDADPSKDAE